MLLSTEKTEENNNDEQGTWEENFGGNTDSKPRGPQAIAMDFTFVGTKHIYGVPEHADRFSLQDTSTSDPYRLERKFHSWIIEIKQDPFRVVNEVGKCPDPTLFN